MKKLILISALLLTITGCGPSYKERQDIAQLTCNIMGESRNMDAAFRIKEINAAREKLGEPVYLGSDEKIKRSFEYGLCVSLVLNDGYDQKKNAIDLAIEEEKRKEREEERIAAKKKAEEERIERIERIAAEKRAEKRAEEERIAKITAKKRADEEKIAAYYVRKRAADKKALEDLDKKLPKQEPTKKYPY
jgi:hypothetical protein